MFQLLICPMLAVCLDTGLGYLFSLVVLMIVVSQGHEIPMQCSLPTSISELWCGVWRVKRHEYVDFFFKTGA
jgi:hypothetical protein